MIQKWKAVDQIIAKFRRVDVFMGNLRRWLRSRNGLRLLVRRRTTVDVKSVACRRRWLRRSVSDRKRMYDGRSGGAVESRFFFGNKLREEMGGVINVDSEWLLWWVDLKSVVPVASTINLSAFGDRSRTSRMINQVFFVRSVFCRDIVQDLWLVTLLAKMSRVVLGWIFPANWQGFFSTTKRRCIKKIVGATGNGWSDVRTLLLRYEWKYLRLSQSGQHLSVDP